LSFTSIAPLFIVAGLGPPSIRDLLLQHPELIVAADHGASCPTRPEPPATDDVAVVQRDLTGDGLPDSALVVMSSEAPRQFGVVALHRTATGGVDEHWVIRLAPTPLASLAFFHSPYGDYLVVHGCSRKDGATFLWERSQYVSEPVW